METKQKEKIKKVAVGLNGHSHHAETEIRLAVQKTYKLYIDGKFPRTESGRYYKLNDKNGKVIANICRASRKDFRDAVVVARKAQGDWQKKSAFNRSQILYRIAETLETRRLQFVSTLGLQGVSETAAQKEVSAAVDMLVYYAGWCDKYQQVFSSVNPVESSHFNFSFPEPTGVVTAIASPEQGLLNLVSLMAPSLAGGNSIIILAAEKFPLTAIDFAEVLNASDVPGGVVNILTGYSKELHTHFSSHMDVNAIVYAGDNSAELKTIQTNAAGNVKRVVVVQNIAEESPYRIMELQEVKTTWHPVGI
ncbi:MAG TPA: aldehyde dehydrogenase family protein [Bacteroidia bacterium]|nr:aldehyde dehydrogenase family protein [Bacteroidia bacterium]MBP7713248.1 aldehyde dehydrogenase family protein [Bacteroidia bacterium]MBP8667203.1 aldehyde dehydrogenase family protein [Bacteroidia bacterium]HOZ81814.1 aldehyde dehydrogenase family protein [Bacteroidia bacterium]HOZ91230.1 aldehyde dehydrogenase family protein [Bacteroidia bacterium]